MRYSFDASAWTGFWHRHYPPDVFPPLYEEMERLIVDGSIRSTVEVRHELERQDDDLLAWTLARDGLYVEIDDPVQEAVREVLERWPELVDGRRNRADPFVVGLARVHGCAVVTQEPRTPRPSERRPRIPEVCDALRVRCLTPLEFLREQRWVFERVRR